MYTIIYFIQFGKDCQCVFPPNQSHLVDTFTNSLTDEGYAYSRIDTDEEGNPIPNRLEVTNG